MLTHTIYDLSVLVAGEVGILPSMAQLHIEAAVEICAEEEGCLKVFLESVARRKKP
jgi:hypothetical protein